MKSKSYILVTQKPFNIFGVPIKAFIFICFAGIAMFLILGLMDYFGLAFLAALAVILGGNVYGARLAQKDHHWFDKLMARLIFFKGAGKRRLRAGVAPLKKPKMRKGK